MKTTLAPSEFKTLSGIEYFAFEEDFIEHNMRCIPMIVRLKLDLSGIKLKLAEWCRFSTAERIRLATLPTDSEHQIRQYASILITLIYNYTGMPASVLCVDTSMDWKNPAAIPGIVTEQLHHHGLQSMSLREWQRLTDLQRFALLKLCRPGHENENFPRAAREFGFKAKTQIVTFSIVK